MKNSRFAVVMLIFVVIFSTCLYFYNLGKVPNGVYVDEATVGYNAYSILNTGKDEFGKQFPIAFRFFGAYTPPLAVYMAVPFIKFLGLNPMSIRILSGLSTLIGIVVVYLFVRGMAIFKMKSLAVLAALLFAVTPWVLFNARLGYEVTLGYVLFGVGSLLLWRGIKKGRVSLPALLILSLSTYAAHTERYLVPIFLLVVATYFYEKKLVLRNRKILLAAAVMLLVTQIPHLFLLTTKAFWVKNEIALGGASITQAVKDFVSQLLTYYSPKELFGVSSDINLQHTMPGLSLFFPWMIVPFLIGIYRLFWMRKTAAGKYLIILFLTAGIPGALSGHFISIQRVLPLIIPIILISVLGIEAIMKRVRPWIFVPALSALILFSLILLWRSYFVFLPGERAGWWNYGYEQIARIAAENPDTTFVVDNTREGAIYMLFLFYQKYSPQMFQTNFSQDFIDAYYTNPPYNGNYKIGNIEVRPVVWEKDIFIDQVLVGDELLMSPDQAKEHFMDKEFEIKDSTGKLLLLGYKTNPEKKIEDNRKKLFLLQIESSR